MTTNILFPVVGRSQAQGNYNKPSIIVNGEKIEADAFINNDNRTMVPISLISNALGYSIEWIPESQMANIWNDDNDMSIQVGNKRMVVNLISHNMDTEPIIINGRTMIPLGAVATALGADISWDNDTKSVIVNTIPEKPSYVINGKISTREYLRTFEKFEKLMSLKEFHTYNNFVTNPDYLMFAQDARSGEAEFKAYILKDGVISEVPVEKILKNPPEYDVAIFTQDYVSVLTHISNTDDFGI
ncbi:copper amine oxidase N-terminal domain-containing protein [Acetoanaerobium pronyense]|uniref:copper amine oxidase N-terminal domain-containing protein n=1 Tax=Acetoanaerobium pronyense TaxID=1482736 RepID=UPI001AEAA15E|nr:copper amine oxidase N-terminal domain-containing protein [Acetoanaerobium pronyense]